MVREGERGWKMGDLRDKGIDPALIAEGGE